ncbi:hypothetical protein Aoki45_22990 [Algoriphagus sp. oki45]|uniref:hypothetical protein n=1 Tax=Algoriphagus sp. oki45 TaxID=3067294 RepID=UPI0027F6C810|nr:hypothetical protein Aoki45_22990 [Algoriphagus sp. oki45]
MRKKVRKKPEPEEEMIPQVIEEKEEILSKKEKEVMTPVDKEKSEMKTSEPGKLMNPL